MTVASGTAGNGMEYARWSRDGGSGRSALFLPGGPGSAVPHGMWRSLAGRQFAAYVEAGFDAWTVTRRRGMPTEHGIAEIADDYAAFVDELLAGRADLVVGTSFGGMVALHLAASRTESVGLLALVASGPAVSAWCFDVDGRIATALRRGDDREAATVFGEYVWADPRRGWVRRLAAPVFRGVLLPGHPAARSDALVELEAERRCDARPLLPHITAPTLVLTGEQDRIFPFDEVLEAARLVPDCEVRRFPGRGHVGMAASARVPGEVLAFAARRGEDHAP